MAMFGSFMDGVTRGMQSPLFLGGVGLLSGGGFQGMNQGIQAGILGDRQRFEQDQQAADRQRQVMMDAENQRRWDIANQRAAAMHPLEMGAKQAQINNLNRREDPEMIRTLKAFGIDPMSEEGRKIGLSKMGGEQPSSVREWNYYNNLPPEQKQEYLNMKRSEKYLDTGTSFVRPNPIDPSRPVASIAKDVKGEAQAKVVGRETGELQMGAPKALAALDAADAKSDVVGRTIAEAKAMVGQNTAGFGGAILKNMPGTAARDLAAKLDTLKANAGFGELQAMRDNSPTGGALGQVAVQELQMLQSTITSIEQAQTPAQLSKALDEFDKFTRESRVRRRKAYDATYGRVTGVEQAPAAPTGGGWSIKRID